MSMVGLDDNELSTERDHGIPSGDWAGREEWRWARVTLFNQARPHQSHFESYYDYH